MPNPFVQYEESLEDLMLRLREEADEDYWSRQVVLPGELERVPLPNAGRPPARDADAPGFDSPSSESSRGPLPGQHKPQRKAA